MEFYKSNVKEGYMFVQNTSVWKPWAMKAKYFILTKECLYCYKRRGDLDAIPKEVIPLDGISVTLDEGKSGLRKRFYIRMTSPQLRKSLSLFCFIPEERNEWLTCILSALTNKYTDKGLAKTARRKSGKTHSLAECEFNRRNQLETLEQTRPFSISCLELTNLSVVMDPRNPTRSAVPIRKTYDITNSQLKKVSSSSLDVALEHHLRGSNSATLKRHKVRSEKSKTLTHKRHKSMSDLLSLDEDLNPCIPTNTISEKKKPKNKRLSIGMLIGNNLNFKTTSLTNLHRLK
jgi:PH domain.